MTKSNKISYVKKLFYRQYDKNKKKFYKTKKKVFIKNVEIKPL